MKYIKIVGFGKYLRLFSSVTWIFTLFSVFFITSCGSSEPSDRKVFEYKLRGTWQSNDPSVYAGELVIEYNSITIWDYLENQTPLLGDDTKRPFREFTKGTRLSGYSEDGIFFIRDAGEWFEIPCFYYTENNGHDKFLRFTFGDRKEILRLVSD